MRLLVRRRRRRAEAAAHEQAHRSAARAAGDLQRHDVLLEAQDRQLALLTERVAVLEGVQVGLQTAGRVQVLETAVAELQHTARTGEFTYRPQHASTEEGRPDGAERG